MKEELSNPIKKIEKLNILFFVAIFLFSIFFFDKYFLYGILAGGGLGILNFRGLYFFSKGLYKFQKPKKVVFAPLLGLKFLLLIVVLYFMIKYIPMNTLGFIIGISTIVISIFMFSIIKILTTKRLSEEI